MIIESLPTAQIAFSVPDVGPRITGLTMITVGTDAKIIAKVVDN